MVTTQHSQAAEAGLRRWAEPVSVMQMFPPQPANHTECQQTTGSCWCVAWVHSQISSPLARVIMITYLHRNMITCRLITCRFLVR